MTAVEPRTHDALGRRLPWAQTKEDPVIDRFFLDVDIDYDIFEFIARHGYASTVTLLERIGERRRNRIYNLNRLNHFSRGSKEQGKLLYAPKGQKNQYQARSRHKLYGLAKGGELLLRRLGRYPEVPPTGSWFIHQVMQATVGAAFELRVPEGLRYVPRSEVLTHSGCPSKDRKYPLSLPLSEKSRKSLVPDDLFALENADGDWRKYLVEVDRNTESYTSEAGFAPRDDATYFKAKLDSYLQAMRGDLFTKHWGFPLAQILIVTTSYARVDRILRDLRALNEPQLTKWFNVTVLEDFGTDWRVPDHVPDLYAREWETINGPRRLIP